MYSVLLDDNKEKKTAKGIKKVAIKKRMTHDDYKRCLFPTQASDAKQFVAFNCFRSFKHQIYTIAVNKVGLCRYDDKRFILDDGISSYSYGHYKITN